MFTLMDKKDIKEALFNVAFMKQTTLAHELFWDITIPLTDTYLPYSIFLAQPFFASVSKGAASTNFYTFGILWPPDSIPCSTN